MQIAEQIAEYNPFEIFTQKLKNYILTRPYYLINFTLQILLFTTAILNLLIFLINAIGLSKFSKIILNNNITLSIIAFIFAYLKFFSQSSSGSFNSRFILQIATFYIGLCASEAIFSYHLKYNKKKNQILIVVLTVLLTFCLFQFSFYELKTPPQNKIHHIEYFLEMFLITSIAVFLFYMHKFGSSIGWIIFLIIYLLTINLTIVSNDLKKSNQNYGTISFPLQLLPIGMISFFGWAGQKNRKEEMDHLHLAAICYIIYCGLQGINFGFPLSISFYASNIIVLYFQKKTI